YLESSRDESTHTFQNVPQEFTVCITRHDYVPYLVSLTLGGQPLGTTPLMVCSAGGNVFDVSFGQSTPVERDVDISRDGVVTVVVSDITTGQVMLTAKTREDGFTIDASGWKRGVYAVRVSSTDGVRTAKILVR
ncbi:MAG: T9SS type A sorting domain-containing protein, partial [Bacteroidaceae bacterium]|nr:T9SS type A sorting domain-containing protein [Bacteroidaceae bacterium]